jgi:hypothetical protein
MKITQDVRDYATGLGDDGKAALNLGGVGMSISGVIEDAGRRCRRSSSTWASSCISTRRR